MRFRILVGSVVAAAAIAPAAGAATVTGTTVLVRPADRHEDPYRAPALSVEAGAGDHDELELSDDGTGVIVRSGSGPLEAAGTCTTRDAVTVVCGFTHPNLVRVDLGAGDDHVAVSGMPAIVDGGPGNDRIDLRAAGARFPQDGADTLVHGGAGDDVVLGSGEDDHLDGGAGDDLLRGGKGFDVLRGGTGADVLGGGADVDELLYGPPLSAEDDDLGTAPAIPVDVDLSTGRATGRADDDRLSGFEAVAVSVGRLSGSAGKDDLTLFDGTLRGRGGDDRLFGYGRVDGGSGDDDVAGRGILRGGSGRDELTAFGSSSVVDGGPGADALELADGKARARRIRCGAGTDRLRLPRGSYGVPADCEQVLVGGLLVATWRVASLALHVRLRLVDIVYHCRPRLRVGAAPRRRTRITQSTRRLRLARAGASATLAVQDRGRCTVVGRKPILLRFPA